MLDFEFSKPVNEIINIKQKNKLEEVVDIGGSDSALKVKP